MITTWTMIPTVLTTTIPPGGCERGAMFVIETLLKTNHELINTIYEECISHHNEENIVRRLGERNENIRLQIISLLQTFLRAIIVIDVPS